MVGVGPFSECNSSQICTIEQAKTRASPSILHVRIKRVFVPQVFERGASTSRTQRVEIEDQTGTFIIACYDELGKYINANTAASMIYCACHRISAWGHKPDRQAFVARELRSYCQSLGKDW